MHYFRVAFLSPRPISYSSSFQISLFSYYTFLYCTLFSQVVLISFSSHFIFFHDANFFIVLFSCCIFQKHPHIKFRLKPCKFIKKRLQDNCFSVKFSKLFKNNFFHRTPLVAASANI